MKTTSPKSCSSQRAFTLVELVIVISILLVISGSVGYLWSGVERTFHASERILRHRMNASVLLDRIEADIRASYQAEASASGGGLALHQARVDGATQTVRYRLQGAELIRQVQIHETGSSVSLGSVRGATFSVQEENGGIAIRWTRDYVLQPPDRKTVRMTRWAAPGRWAR